MKSLTIALAPNGSFRLQLPTHFVDIPATEAGIHLLATTIRDWTQDAKIATPGSPTQAQILEALRGASWGEPKQLAGHSKRRADIKAATGVVVRPAKKEKHQLSLADLGL
ncbi:MAG: hypothetical protein DMF62_03560 [Acidobacteria bacterium]|nr:MAG: hypothetical protein DMF62_03560 [Acidobacteriota bacterium]